MYPAGIEPWFVENNAVIAERMPVFGLWERIELGCRLRDFEHEISLVVAGSANETEFASDVASGDEVDDSFVGLDGGDSIPIIETLFPTGVDLVLVEAVACGLRSLKRSGPGWKFSILALGPPYLRLTCLITMVKNTMHATIRFG